MDGKIQDELGVEAARPASLERMAAEAELLLGNLLYVELGPEVCELFRAALQARELRGVEREARRALRLRLPLSEQVLRGLQATRRRLARAQMRFALREDCWRGD